MLSRNVLLHGVEAPVSAPLALRAGPLSLLFDPETAFLRRVRLGGAEALRGVYAAVRDRNWGTIAPVLSNLTVDAGPDRFRLAFDADCRQGDVDFAWRGEIVGRPDGSVDFTFDGTARATFLRNRIGFCVLHPDHCAGTPCAVLHSDGSLEHSRFPAAIAPHQPFLDMRAITHPVAEGVSLEVRLEGDVFEMEDQRNWSDASFKTYCTPLALPFPVDIPAGARVRQAVRLRLVGQPPAASAGDEGACHIRLTRHTRRLPPIGLGSASHGRPLSVREGDLLRATQPSHLRVDLRLGEPDWYETLTRAIREAGMLDCALEPALFVTDDAEAELRALRAELDATRPRIARWLVFHVNERTTSCRWADLARRMLPGPIWAGSNAYFTEINREHPPARALDGVCYSLNPQVHAFDDLSVVENLSAQATTVESARGLAEGRPVAVTPVTLRRRFNADATGPVPPTPPGELPLQVDPRQVSLLGAAWTVGSLKYLAEAGADSLTYYETTGWRGLIETRAGSSEPDLFRSIPGAAFPLYHVFAGLAGFREGRVRLTKSDDPLRVVALALQAGARQRLLIANLTPRAQEALVDLAADAADVVLLDDTTAEDAMLDPAAFAARNADRTAAPKGILTLSLRPYAVARVDVA